MKSQSIVKSGISLAGPASKLFVSMFADFPERYYSVIRESEEARKKKLSSMLLISTTPIFFLFLLYHLMRTGNIIPIVFNSVIIATQLANVIIFSKTRFWNTANGLNLIMYSLYFYIAIILGGPEGSYVFWALLFPPAALCLLSPGTAFRWTVLFITGSIVLVAAGPRFVDMYHYAPSSLLRFYLVITIMVMIIFQFEKTRIALIYSLKLNDEKLVEEKKRSDEARATAVDALRVKDRFLASVSHEIRTPLSLIIGMSDLARKEDDVKKISEYLDDINDSSQHLLILINNVLDFTKLESESFKLDCNPFDLKDLLEKIVRSFSMDFRAKNLSLEGCYDERLPRMFSGDVTRIRQIISNMVSNACKYTESGGVAIRIGPGESGENESTPQGRGNDALPVRIDVQDTGIGISREQYGEIFLPFVQLGLQGGSRSGVGLGLAIVKKLVEYMGGAIEVARPDGGGALFRVMLPLVKATGRDAGVPVPDNVGSRESAGALAILIAEDNPAIVKMLRTVLSRSGHEVVSAENGYKVIDILAKRRFDLVLMDVEMPMLDGIETAKRIRGGSGGVEASSVPIIALTAHVLMEIEEQCLRAGMNGMIRKPFDLFSIEGEINKILRGR